MLKNEDLGWKEIFLNMQEGIVISLTVASLRKIIKEETENLTKHNSRLKKDFSKCDGCGWKKKIVFILIMAIILSLVGCNNSYSDCKYDCLRYRLNCSIEGSFCIPSPCNTNHICSNDDVKQCNEGCS